MEAREIDAEIAEKVMGWKSTNGKASRYSASYTGPLLIRPDGKFDEPPPYSTDPAASKQLREKLAERFCGENCFFTLDIYTKDQFMFSMRDDEGARLFDCYGEADTEEMAVALCAIKALIAAREGK